MKQEDRKLLLIDLYARLPYGIKFKAEDDEYIREIYYIKGEDVYIREYRNLPYWIDTIKPYLRPMSSMTKEEKKELQEIAVALSYNKDDIMIGTQINSFRQLDGVLDLFNSLSIFSASNKVFLNSFITIFAFKDIVDNSELSLSKLLFE